MSIEHNKRVAAEFYTRFDANDIPGALGTMADDITFWIAGQPGSSRVVGTQTKDEIARVFYAMTSRMKDGLRMKVKSIIAEGDKVALEVESRGELNNGRIYNQQYHALMTIRDGKIAAVKEYLDTRHAFEIWFQP
jgi:uncharacterized protein